VMVAWTRLGSPAALAAFAQAVEDVPRTVQAGSTAIGEALQACARLLAAAPAPSRRQVIDMVGDGRSNEGIPPAPVRDRLAAAGVTINGLCVLHEEADLLATYADEVIGGPGAFALQCQDYAGFADAMRQKLQREIAQNRASPRALSA
jgi:Ca-activated chloride channel family protein